MLSYKAEFQGEHRVVYSFDAAKAWVCQQAGRTLRWVSTSDGKAWYGYRTRTDAERAAPDAPVDYLGRIVSSAHADF